MNPNQTIETYIATNNPDDVLMLLKELGAPKPKNKEELVKYLHKATEKYPDRAFEKLAKIETPYYQLIMANIPPAITKHSSCDGGCSGCNGEKSNMDSATATTYPKAVEKETIIEKVKDVPAKANTFINEHPMVSGAIGTALVVLTVIGLVKLLK